MNKRIKNKIIKSVSTKLESGNSLTGFEEAYFNKHLYNFVPTHFLYEDNARVQSFNNSNDVIDALRYSLENQEVNHTHFHTDEIVSVLSVGYGKMTLEVPESKMAENKK